MNGLQHPDRQKRLHTSCWHVQQRENVPWWKNILCLIDIVDGFHESLLQTVRIGMFVAHRHNMWLAKLLLRHGVCWRLNQYTHTPRTICMVRIQCRTFYRKATHLWWWSAGGATRRHCRAARWSDRRLSSRQRRPPRCRPTRTSGNWSSTVFWQVSAEIHHMCFNME